MAINTESAYNTPQAVDDFYALAEQGIEAIGGYIQWLDVMANDLGGKAKTLYSIDNGDDLAELFQQDAQVTFESSALGAQIYIRDGKIAYDMSLLAGQIDALAAGESMTDTLTYSIRLGNGTLSFGEVQISITGNNDAPTILAADDAALIVEDAVNPILAGIGKIAFDDVDLSDTHSATVQPAMGNALGGMLVASVTDPTTGVGGEVSWTYEVANSATQHLAAGESVTETFTISVADNHGLFVSRDVTVTILGTNDAAAITGASEAVVAEDAANIVSGNLDATDIDGPDDAFVAVASASAAGYGTYTVDATGHWAYALDNDNAAVNALRDGETLSDSFTVQTADGTTQVVNITILGSSDGVILPAVYHGLDPNDGDTLIGDPANRVGTDDANLIRGTSGADVINGYGGDDAIDANHGADLVFGGSGDDVIIGNVGLDTLYGQAGDDQVSGDENIDQIFGGSGDDIIDGGFGGDILYGGSGDDIITGAGAEDVLIGGYGQDTLTGGNLNDIFRYLDMKDTGDTITDFTRGKDLIEFSAIDANSADGGDQAFIFGGTTATAHGLWYATDGGGNASLYLDTDGDTGTAELAITLNGVANLAAGDFIL